MSYRNRDLIRRPFAMLRLSAEEEARVARWINDATNGGSRGDFLRDVVLKEADEYAHQSNSLSPARLDTSLSSRFMPQ